MHRMKAFEKGRASGDREGVQTLPGAFFLGAYTPPPPR